MTPKHSTYVVKSVRDLPLPADGRRVLVDRLWPRGISRERAALDDWAKDLAPSPDLRRWFDHRGDRFDEFKDRYVAELASNPLVRDFHEQSPSGRTSLIYAAHNPTINHAVVLAAFLMRLK